MIHTVRGPVQADALGVTLMHEHVLVDFAGATLVHPSRYDTDEAVALVLPHLRRLADHGCRTFVECTPSYLGRDPALLARLSEASGLNILTNTGYYGVQLRYLPPQAFGETASGIARRWIGEWRRGIDGTSIKPAFMKISVSAAPLSPLDIRLLDAAGADAPGDGAGDRLAYAQRRGRARSDRTTRTGGASTAVLHLGPRAERQGRPRARGGRSPRRLDRARRDLPGVTHGSCGPGRRPARAGSSQPPADLTRRRVVSRWASRAVPRRSFADTTPSSRTSSRPSGRRASRTPRCGSCSRPTPLVRCRARG